MKRLANTAHFMELASRARVLARAHELGIESPQRRSTREVQRSIHYRERLQGIRTGRWER
jgi:hypothetical protein